MFGFETFKRETFFISDCSRVKKRFPNFFFHHLFSSLFSLIIKKRVGGRTESIKYNGVSVDLGGQWIGPHHKLTMELVERFGLKIFPQYASGRHVVQVGENLEYFTDDKVDEKSSAGFLEAAAEKVDKMAENLSDSGMKHGTWSEEEKKMDSITFSKFLEELEKDPKVGQLGSKLLGMTMTTLISAEPEEYSLLFFLYFLKSCVGYHPLVDVDKYALLSSLHFLTHLFVCHF